MADRYELTLVLKTAVSDADRKKIEDEVDKIIAPKGKIVNKQDFGKRLLAYPIRKEKEANYWIYTLEAEGKGAGSLSGKLQLNASVLRFLVLRTDVKAVTAKNKETGVKEK